ncbi:hypothetical protein [Bdellovibrio sp. HCB-162]|uniref:hypothetical protein n=1 Tax=Bdellovibrio sp. HCB-162 TaxID=3394234 RepID=UPI0039BD6F1B
MDLEDLLRKRAKQVAQDVSSADGKSLCIKAPPGAAEELSKKINDIKSKIKSNEERIGHLWNNQIPIVLRACHPDQFNPNSQGEI